MSAIAGICRVDGRPADPALVARMTRALAHRAPDGEGHWVSGPIGLGYRLLVTTPESLHEKQPVTDERSECWLVWDGRLDNRGELIAALRTEGRDLGAETDPELALAAYRQWGVSALRKIVGDFALALWDSRTRRLVCARDPMGVKPLYYHWDGKRLTFASEVKALFGDPTVPRRPNEAAIADYLLMGFRDPEATFFEGIKQVRPAYAASLGDADLRLDRYWDADPSREIRYARHEEYFDEFRALFRDAVRARLRSGSPVAALLSGGIDSTLVAAMAESLRRADAAAPEVPAFTLLAGCFREEWEAVQRLVGTYGTELHPVEPGPGFTGIDLFLDGAENPHYDTFATIPLLLNPALARGCRVVLTGFGGDELSRSAERGFLEDLCRSVRLDRLARNVRQWTRAYDSGHWQKVILELLWSQLSPHLRRRVKTLLARQVPRWVDRSFARRAGLNRWMLPTETARLPTLCAEETYRALTKPATALALNHLDAAAAAFTLEGRHPYLDRRLIEFFLAIPPAVKMRNGYRKQFVQRALAGVMPGPIRDREGPDSFVPPMDEQASRGLDAKRMARDLFRPGARIFRYVDRAEAERLRDRYLEQRAPGGGRLWRFVALEAWLQQSFPEWSRPGGDPS